MNITESMTTDQVSAGNNSPVTGANVISNATSLDSSSIYMLHPFEISLFVLLYASTIISAVVGNSLVIWIVVRNKQHRKSNTNHFIINLALVDLFLMIFNLPWTFTYSVNGNVWPWGKVWCKSVWSVGTVALSANAFTFAALMIDRHRAIADPLQKYADKSNRAVHAVIVIWLLSILSGIPTLIGYDTIEISQSSSSNRTESEVAPRTVCYNTWSPERDFIHMVVLASLQYVIPLTVTVAAYILIRGKLHKSTAIGESSTAEAAAIRTKQRLVSMMMVVVVTFSVCVMPQNVLVLVMSFPSKEFRQRWLQPAEHGRAIIRTFLIVYWLAMSTSLWNPLIYAYWSMTFRLGFRYAFRCLPCVRWDDHVDGGKFFDHRRTFSSRHTVNKVPSAAVPPLGNRQLLKQEATALDNSVEEELIIKVDSKDTSHGHGNDTQNL